MTYEEAEGKYVQRFAHRRGFLYHFSPSQGQNFLVWEGSAFRIQGLGLILVRRAGLAGGRVWLRAGGEDKPGKRSGQMNHPPGEESAWPELGECSGEPCILGA